MVQLDGGGSGTGGGDDTSDTDSGDREETRAAVRQLRRRARSAGNSLGSMMAPDPEPEFQRDRSSTSRFLDELGGDPAGDTDRTADSRDDTTARPSGGGDIGPSPEDLTEPTPSEPVDRGGELEQGIEESGATESVEQQAQDFEQEILANNPGLTGRDVSVSLVGTQAGPTFEAEFTEGAENRVQARLRDIAAGLGLGPGSLAATGGTDPAADAQAEQRAERQEALEGIGAFEELAEQEQEQLEAIEAQLERQIGEQRAATFGAVDPAQTRQQIERTDLEAGTDFTIETGEEETRTFTDPETGEQVTETVTPIEATLTEDFEREFLSELVGFDLARQFGTEFEPEEDFTLNETDDDGFEPLLTNAGRAKAQTQNLRRTVADFEARVFGVGDTQFQFDIPGEGPLLPESDPDRDLGQVDIPVRMGPEDEFTTFEAVLEDAEEAILDATEQQEAAVLADDSAARGRAGAALRTERRNFEPEGPGTKPVQQFSQSALRGLPLFATGAVGLAKDASEFGYSLGEAAILGDFERAEQLVGNLADAGTEQAVLAAESVARDPGEFAARGVGSAVASLPLFGAASAIGPRASFLTRYGIQPGEELLGAGLNLGARGVGRAVRRPEAGRRVAETIAPNREPVFFSEEAAIRGARGLTQRGRNVLAEGRETLARISVEPRVGAGIVPPRLKVEGKSEPVRITGSDLSMEKATSELGGKPGSGVTSVPRKPSKESITRQQDPAFGGTGKPNVGVERDFEGVRETLGFEDPKSPRKVLTTEEKRARLGFETETETRGIFGFDSEAETLSRTRRAESAVLGEDLLTDAQAQQVAAQVTGVRADTRLDELLEPASETLQRFDIDARQDLRGELDQRGETRSELEQRMEPNPLESRFEPAEVESRSEAEAEGRFRFESEAEAEVNLDDDQLFEDEEELVADWFGDETFGSGIAAGGEAAFEDIERDLISGFEDAEAEATGLDEFEQAEKDLLDDFDL